MTTQTNEANLPRELTGHCTEAALGYQRMLEENPCHPKALVGMTLVALASRQSSRRGQNSRSRCGRRAGDGCGLGRAGPGAEGCHGRSEEAECAYGQAIRLDGMNPLARLALGELRLAAGRPEDAVREFELALRRTPC
jgi:tetratricopeptide (TPR) repeat protein